MARNIRTILLPPFRVLVDPHILTYWWYEGDFGTAAPNLATPSEFVLAAVTNWRGL